MSVHDFACPDCGKNCQLIQREGDGKSSVRHSLPECSTWKATRADGQKFLELAFLARHGAAAIVIGGRS